MTLKQTKLLRNLETSKTVMEAGTKAGYSPQARMMYRPQTKLHIAKAIGSKPELIIKSYEDLASRCRAKGDLATERAVYDSLCRVNGMFRDKTEVNVRSFAPSAISVEELQEARRALEIESVKSIQDLT